MAASESADIPQLTPAQRAAELGAQLDELLAVGKVDAVCDLVARLFAERSDAGDLPEVAALVSALPDSELAQHPQVLLELARACDAEARVRLRTRMLDRAERLPLSGLLKVAVAVALEAERIADLARDGHADEVEARVAALAPQLRAGVPEADSTFVREARSRCTHALGRVLTWRGDPTSIAAAEDALQTSAGAARELGRHEWRAQSLLTLGFGVHFYRGEELRAIDRLREAIGLLPAGHPRRAAISCFLAEVFVRSHTGDQAVPLLADARAEAAVTGDQRALGYAAWLMAMVTSEAGDRGATLEWLADAERHPGDWFEHPTGIEFLAEAALCAERVGEYAAADRYLERARERAAAAGYPDLVWFAIGVINARRGDAAEAVTVLSQLLEESWWPPRDRWVVWLHLALARLQTGDQDGAAQDAARGFESASSLVGAGRAAATREDLPDVLTKLQADLVQRLAPIVAATGSQLAAAIAPVRPRIRLFGGLAVQLGAGSAALPPGRPALLLMLVAISRSPITIDAAIDELWPEVSAELGRRRMRNVLARIKASCGELLLRSGDTLTLVSGTMVDLAEFRRACERVDRALPSDRPALARAALGLYRAPLLPEAAYAPRVARVRDELDRRSVDLLEIVAAEAIRVGSLDQAVAALARVTEIDPYDAETPARIEALLRTAGRAEQAGVWHDRARVLRED